MQEDAIGTQAAAGVGRSYATCSECGSVFPRLSARIEPAALDEGHSEYTELCPECENLDRQGEQPILPDAEGA
jgi:hypothetical protein